MDLLLRMFSVAPAKNERFKKIAGQQPFRNASSMISMLYPLRRIAPALLLSAGVLLLLFITDPLKAPFFPRCAFRLLTGLDCPGCGSARGMHALLHGSLGASADYNALLMPGLLMLTVGGYHKITAKGGRLWQLLNRPRIVLLIICLFWILRNIPVYPLTVLSSAH